MAEHEKKEHEHKEHSETKEVTIKKSTLKAVSIAIVMLIIGIAAGYGAAVLTARPSATGSATGGDATAIGEKVVKYLNDNLVQPGTTATLSSVDEENGFYVVTTLYQGSEIPVYVDATGNMLFTSAPLLLNESLSTGNAQATETPKTDKPEVELFVMSFCPYGVQAEQIMKPVVDLLGSKADIKVRFIANVGGTTVDSVQSLHGTLEAQEDLRQVCVMKYYPDDYWSYVMDIDENCYPTYRTAGALDTCWKAAATKLGMDVAKIDTCSKGQEGIDLLKADEQLADTYGVSGSPTLIINGADYNGARSSDAYKQAICAAFVTPPAECGTVVAGSNVTAPAGGCGA